MRGPRPSELKEHVFSKGPFGVRGLGSTGELVDVFAKGPFRIRLKQLSKSSIVEKSPLAFPDASLVVDEVFLTQTLPTP